MINLADALRLSKCPVVAFVGAGGKTSAMFRCARDRAPALVTTSTHLGVWQASLADRHFIWAHGTPLPDLEAQLASGITLVTGSIDPESRRCSGLSLAQMEILRQLAGYHDLPLFIEADGARLKALKAPGADEPVIPAFVDAVVVVAGLTGLGKKLEDEVVFRSEVFGRLGDLELDDVITPSALARVLAHPEGGLKNIPAGARRLVILNQADTPILQSQSDEIARYLLPFYEAVVVSTLNAQPGSVLAIRETIAAVILAAGASTRYGQPKQLLDYHGKSFVRTAAETALRAGLSPVVVVTGANSGKVSAEVSDLPLLLIHNPDWQSGQSSSLKAGVAALPENVGGALFLIVDQPQVTVELLLALVERHSQDLPAILAPYVFDQRANPLLFDRITFPDLLRVTGDTGGRAIFSKFSPRYLNWYDRSLLLDVDTPQDYQKLLGDKSAP